MKLLNQPVSFRWPFLLMLRKAGHGRFQDFGLGGATYWLAVGQSSIRGPKAFIMLADWGGPWPRGPPPGTAHVSTCNTYDILRRVWTKTIAHAKE